MVRSLSIILVCSLLFPQSLERGNPDFRRWTNIDVNKVRTSILNWGISGRAGNIPSHVPYEWPVNSGQMYIALAALAVGAEVITNEGEIRPLVTIPFRSDQSGNSMAWEPVAGYLNPNSQKIAISDDQNSWPTSWPDKINDLNDPGWSGSWNGFFGRNQFNAQQEIYYKLSDDRNYLLGNPYSPDTTDLNRQGAGLLAGVRVLEWKQILIEDVVFILHEIKNDGSYDYDKVSFSMWLADLVGGDGDAGDDTPDFDLIYDVAWSMDSDGVGNSAFGSDLVGVAATSFIETPGNNIDRIDNDGDGEDNGPIITEGFIMEELLGNAIDDNGNGLIDENLTHVPFGDQMGVTYADKLDNDLDGESNSPIVDQEMINGAAMLWGIWPRLDDDIQDSIIHIVDKFGLANDVYQLLSPGGWFLASDWLCGYEGEPSVQMQAYIDAEGLDFGLAAPEVYQKAFKAAGFVDIELEERNTWYRTQARVERDNLAGPLYDELLGQVGEEFLIREIDVWDKMIVVLDSGEHRPTLLRARRKM